jgi:hypothetical protein
MGAKSKHALVMAGPVPAIHVFASSPPRKH